MSVSIFRNFEANPFGHGGEKRSFQIQTIINREQSTNAFITGLPNDCLPWYKKYPILSIAKSLLVRRNIQPLIHHTKEIFFNIIGQTQLKRYLQQHQNVLQNSTAIIWESCYPELRNFPVLAKKIAPNVPIIACLHNLESIVNQPYFYWGTQKMVDKLAIELSYLKNCDAVFTISEEEEWLLQTLGIQAYYLPYTVEAELLTYLLNIREQRNLQQTTNTYLVLGSASNYPTARGMEQLIMNVIDNSSLCCSMLFHVLGFQTEQFKKYENDIVKILGTVSKHKLEEEMIKCSGIIINQGFSSGSLTKITEFLTAGIPVFCDRGSARSFRRKEGIYVFDNFKHLVEILQNFKHTPVPLSANEHSSDAFFLNQLK